MQHFSLILILFFSFQTFGQFAPQATAEGTTAISKDSSIIVVWATAYEQYIAGTDVDEQWQDASQALGPAEGTSSNIVSLGRGGQITLSFDTLIVNRPGADFVCFENGFTPNFLELGWVEVSYDGIDYIRFPNYSYTNAPVDAFGSVDPTKIDGYCSKYQQAYGTPFDLDSVGLDSIRYIRLVDIVGDGSALDSHGHPIYDPYPTSGSAGLDIDAVGVIHAGKIDESIYIIQTENINIYPNPADDHIIVETIHELSLHNNTVEIFNLSGQLVKQAMIENSSLSIDTYGWQDGMYIIKIGHFKKLFVVQH
ncbi:MAG: T9SS type A sorting domain-containing protein [Bacteroidales bacterium]|nr:T9SS type A sorting domain-containing protein [Bacteroidales bacterium]